MGQIDNRKEAGDVLGKLPRSGPTAERVAGRGSDVRVDRYGQVRLSTDLPETLVRMRSKGSVGDTELKAAAWLISIYETAFGSTMRGVNYAERVSASGGARTDGASAAQISARDSWEWAMGLLIPEVRQVVEGVVIRGSSLTGLDGFVGSYSSAKARQQIAGAFLQLGLKRMAFALGLTVVPK